ncbi:photosystem II reaction center PsbP [Lyngbya aestuarii]|uniref:photosystem II reaction center PsbP n=1 Tax=Lyngbya aestuarii TaxID=118322 RepID=UPI00403DFDED
MLKKIAALLVLVLSLGLYSCTVGVSGLQSYVDSVDGYEFLYPSGWLPVQVNDGPDVVFHDLIERTENISVVISPVPEDQTLADLGTPGEVGYQLQKNAIAPPDSGRQAELVNAEARESGDNIYYLLEYSVKLPEQKRHNIASVALKHGKLYTLNASSTERRWKKAHNLFEQVVQSFTVY